MSDTGNVFAVSGLPPSPPYYNGRLSNGPVWVERLAERLGLPSPAPSLVGGTNYAWAGATTGAVANPFGVPNIDAQVALYLTGLGSATPAANELFVLWGGANDIINTALDPLGPVDPALPVQSLSAYISSLATAGARQFLVANLAPASPLPLDATWVAEFNTTLSAELDNLQSSQPDLSIFRVDYFALYQQVVADPAAFGFTNITDPACQDCGFGEQPNPMNIVPNPDEHFFWDVVHPTGPGHRLLGDLAYQAVVPEPASLLLFAGAVILGSVPRIRRLLSRGNENTIQ